MRKIMGDTKSYSDKEIIAVLGEKTEFKGVLTFMGTARIDGKFEGEVRTKDTLIVGKSANIKSEISAGTIIVQGKIHGNLVASKKVEIMAGSELIGNIKAPSLHIDENAIFDGSREMIKKDPKSFNKKDASPTPSAGPGKSSDKFGSTSAPK